MKRNGQFAGKYLIIVLLTLILAAVAFFGIRSSYNYEDNPFAVLVKTSKNNQLIELYRNDIEDCYYMFLPSYADDSNARIRLLTTSPVYIDEMKMSEGMNMENIVFDHEYVLRVKDEQIGTVIFMHSDKIASLFITTSKRDLSLLSYDKELYDEGEISIIDEDGNVEYSGELESISGRGNQSWSFDKKGWAIRLPREMSLLGMRSSDKWNLIANVCDDTDGLRNVAAHYLAAELDMEFVSEQRFVDLYINSLYYGTYQLVEKIEQKENKLDIGDMDMENLLANRFIMDTETIERYTEYGDDGLPVWSYSMNIVSPEDISGGYIIERNYGYKLKEKEHLFSTDRDEPFVVRYPSVVNEEELIYIRSVVQKVEDALFDEGYIDPETSAGIWELADLDSFAKKFLVDEASKNSGAGVTSSYYYKKKGDDRLYAGPMWDFDKSFGNYHVWEDYNGLSLAKLHIDPITYWYERIYENPEARKLIEEYYTDTVRPCFEKLSESLIDEWAKEIKESYRMNEARWRYITENDPGYFDGLAVQYLSGLDEAKDYLKGWIRGREGYLDSIWANEESE